MIKTLARLLCVPGLALGLALPAWAVDCKLPDSPAGAKLQMVAPEMRVADVPSSIRIMRAPGSVQDTLGWYRRLWAPLATPQRPGSREDEVDGWKVISTIKGDCFYTVQVRAEGQGSHALISVIEMSNASRPRVTVVKDFPMLPGSRVESDATFVDGAVRNGRTLVTSNTSNLAANINYYTRTLRDQGWVTTMHRQPEGPRGASHVLGMRRGTEQLDLVIAPGQDGEINVVAHMVNRP